MALDAPPILHVLAGPNGAGKSTLYDAVISRWTTAEFVNPDQLVLEVLGRHALTLEDAKLGQDLANSRRQALMDAGESLVTESTFSHPSKLELVEAAKAQGYLVAVYHVNVDTPDLAVARVANRANHGGHPVPEDRIRGRYDRNRELIAQALRVAHRGFVFDNSLLGAPPRLLLRFVAGQATGVAPNLPAWAAELYADDLARAANNLA